MPALFGRQLTVTVGTHRITGLDMAFRIVQSTNAEPNKCEVTIWNLNADSRAALEPSTQTPVPVEILAGYTSNAELVFKGNLRTSGSVKKGADWITTLKSGDGEAAFRTARINESFAPGTPIRTVLQRVAQSFGLGLGDSLARIDGATMRESLTEFGKGRVVSGLSKDIFDRFIKAHGLEWSIQDGVIQVLPRGQASNAPAVLLRANTGLIGSPEAGENGVVKFTSLLQPSIRPGRKIRLESTQLTGFYRVEKATHYGDKAGSPWYTDIEGRPL